MDAMTVDLSLLIGAIRNGGAVPFFQPIIHRDDDLPMYEVLGRIRVGETTLNPGQFLPLLEGTPHQEEFDREILVAAIRQAAKWHRETGTHVHIHVNASAEVLESDGYVTLVREILYTHNVPPSTLTVEILETCRLFWENTAVLETLRQLRQSGVQIAIDDFPTCEDPEGLLEWMHRQDIGDFQVLKLDRSIVQHACKGSPTHADAIADYVHFAHEHGMRIVVEGVETEHEVSCMRDLGADEFQGYAYGKPEPAERAYHVTRGRAMQRLQQPENVYALR